MNDPINDPLPPMVPNEPGKNNNTYIIIAVVVILLCCCCAVLLGGWFYGDQILQALGM